MIAPAFPPNALRVLERRYLGEGETPEAMLRRVADGVALAEARYDEVPERWSARFYEAMAKLEFLPNTPTLMNAGRPEGQLAACFVLPVDDSLDGIFETLKQAARIHQSGGGCGYSFSRLRPRNDRVKKTHGVSSGPVSFMQVYDAATETIKQGSARRGANMGILRVDHPDVEEFVTAKKKPGVLTNFNVSVAITDAFMRAVERDERYALVNPRTGEPVGDRSARAVFDLIVESAWASGEPGVVFIDRINADHPTPLVGEIESTNPCVTGDTRIWVEDLGWVPIREMVGKTPRVATSLLGQVGFARAIRVVRTGVRPVLRLETLGSRELRMTEDHLVTTLRGDVAAAELRPGDRVVTVDGYDAVQTIEPDGIEEVFDLSEPETRHFFANGMLVHNCGEQPLPAYESCTLGSIDVAKFETGSGIDRDRLADVVHTAVRFLDDVIDVNAYPLAEIATATRASRRIGLGVMGFADLLVRRGVPYDSEEALAVAAQVASFVQEESKKASAALAQARGAFPAWPGSAYDGEPDPAAKGVHRYRGLALRNATTTTVAPTGTLSILAGCSGGIEPIYALALRRNVLDGESLVEVSRSYEEVARREGFDSEALRAHLGRTGTLRGRDDVPAKWRRVLVTAPEVAPEWHVRMQAAWQKEVDAGVSKTINFPKRATVDEVRKAYVDAYRLGCKGITVYRDGSRGAQVLETGLNGS